jgi:hypothetical protein
MLYSYPNGNESIYVVVVVVVVVVIFQQDTPLIFGYRFNFRKTICKLLPFLTGFRSYTIR